MRKLRPRFLETDAFAEWSNRAARARADLLERVRAGETPSACFRPKLWQEFKKEILLRDSTGKCAFCEGWYVAGSPDDCEHFRPKGGVTNDRRDITHPGYYWLAYEWQNLLLSCRNCNSSHSRGDVSHPGKLNEFPIGGTRIERPCENCDDWWEELKAEEPLLLHPYFDVPEKHLASASHGAVKPLSERGRITIDVCDLNRPELMAAREREELRWQERLKRSIDRTSRETWFSVEEPFSMYLNSRLHQAAQEAASRFAAPPAGDDSDASQ